MLYKFPKLAIPYPQDVVKYVLPKNLYGYMYKFPGNFELKGARIGSYLNYFCWLNFSK